MNQSAEPVAPTKRSAIAFAFGASTGVRMASTPSARKTASKARENPWDGQRAVPRRDGYRPSDCDELERMQMLKTGSLLVACVRCGTLLSTNRTDPAFDRFAESLGSLFQVVDDILDETGKARWLGKIPGSDRRAGKVTHVTMFGLPQARETAKALHERSPASLEEIALYAPGPIQPLREIADMVHQRKK